MLNYVTHRRRERLCDSGYESRIRKKVDMDKNSLLKFRNDSQITHKEGLLLENKFAVIEWYFLLKEALTWTLASVKLIFIARSSLVNTSG